MNSEPVPINFVVGSRRVFRAHRQLRTVACSLEQLITGVQPDFGDDDPASDGYRVLSVLDAVRISAARAFANYKLGGLQRFHRHYIDMSGGFAAYMAHFSGKTRSTLNRKRRKLAQLNGGAIDIAEFRTPDEIARFFAEAIPLSRRTYQARLLGTGLPEGDSARKQAMRLAAQDELRAFVLRVAGRVAAYLYLPVEGATLVYAFLGHDSDLAQYSPGTVLQLEALERLFGETRYRYFDFTDGEGAHKTMFGTDSIEACSFYLLRSSLRNRLLLGSLDAFDGMVANAKRVATRTGTATRIRQVLRS